MLCPSPMSPMGVIGLLAFRKVSLWCFIKFSPYFYKIYDIWKDWGVIQYEFSCFILYILASNTLDYFHYSKLMCDLHIILLSIMTPRNVIVSAWSIIYGNIFRKMLFVLSSVKNMFFITIQSYFVIFTYVINILLYVICIYVGNNNT